MEALKKKKDQLLSATASYLTPFVERRYAAYYTKQFQIYDKAADKAKLKKNLTTVVGLLKKFLEMKKNKTQGNAKEKKIKKWVKKFNELLQDDKEVFDINAPTFDTKLKELNNIKITLGDRASDFAASVGNIYGPGLRFT